MSRMHNVSMMRPVSECGYSMTNEPTIPSNNPITLTLTLCSSFKYRGSFDHWSLAHHPHNPRRCSCPKLRWPYAKMPPARWYYRAISTARYRGNSEHKLQRLQDALQAWCWPWFSLRGGRPSGLHRRWCNRSRSDRIQRVVAPSQLMVSSRYHWC